MSKVAHELVYVDGIFVQPNANFSRVMKLFHKPHIWGVKINEVCHEKHHKSFNRQI